MLSLRSVWQRTFRPVLPVLWELLQDGLQFLNVVARSRTAVAAEVLFLRKQLAYYRDHQIRPRRLTTGTDCRVIVRSERRTSSVVFITNTGRNSASLERRRFLRRTVSVI